MKKLLPAISVFLLMLLVISCNPNPVGTYYSKGYGRHDSYCILKFNKDKTFEYYTLGGESTSGKWIQFRRSFLLVSDDTIKEPKFSCQRYRLDNDKYACISVVLNTEKSEPIDYKVYSTLSWERIVYSKDYYYEDNTGYERCFLDYRNQYLEDWEPVFYACYYKTRFPWGSEDTLKTFRFTIMRNHARMTKYGEFFSNTQVPVTLRNVNIVRGDSMVITIDISPDDFLKDEFRHHLQLRKGKLIHDVKYNGPNSREYWIYRKASDSPTD